MAEYNLLRTVPKVYRDIRARKINKDTNRALALKFGEEYFDGPREQGYGGYRYDGRWVDVAKDLIARFDLKPGDKVLDIGCAKGFLVKDLLDQGIDAYGLDVSLYGITHCPPEVVGRLHLGNAMSLPFPDASFDAVLCINTLHNLERDECRIALREIGRLCRQPANAFVQVDAYRNEEERDLFLDWVLTAKTFGLPQMWLEIFREAGYAGDYYWTILEAGTR